jgi:glycosyltransferase involved in cell wall biosynthesis
MSTVDILMPVRNAEPFLPEAVGSILAQTFTDWRLIAVDDRSEDGTWGILCSFGKRDERILTLKNEGAGITRALNTSLVHSRAPFLVRMDADDISESDRLAKLLSFMQSDPAIGVTGSCVAVFPPEAVSSNMKRYIDWQNSLLSTCQIRRERYVESTMTHATAMFRRDVLQDADGWLEGPFPEDLDLWLRLHRTGVKFGKHPEVLYLWREHPDRETRSSDRCGPEAFHRCKIMHLSAEFRERSIGRIAIIGPLKTGRRWGQSMEKEGFEVATSPWIPKKAFPEEAAKADFVLAAFGVPEVRKKAREQLEPFGEEDEKWLFVG